jgi:hypothetical protein
MSLKKSLREGKKKITGLGGKNFHNRNILNTIVLRKNI